MARHFTEEDALIVVDAQHDFILESGALSVPDGHEIIVPIADFGSQGFVNIAFTGDKHPRDHAQFSDNPDFKETWPPHCIDGTPGSDVHPHLVQTFPNAEFFAKGRIREHEQYSGFAGENEDGQNLLEWLDERSVSVVYVCGLVDNICVEATVMDALKHGFSVVVLAEGIRGLSYPATVLSVQRMVEAGATFA